MNMLRGCYSDFGVSLTYPQRVVRVGLVHEFGERHDKRTNG